MVEAESSDISWNETCRYCFPSHVAAGGITPGSGSHVPANGHTAAENARLQIHEDVDFRLGRFLSMTHMICQALALGNVHHTVGHDGG